MTIHERYPFVWRESRKKAEVIEEESAEKKLMKSDIGVLALKPRAYNALKRNSVNTIEDLIARWAHVPRMNKVGETSVAEIKVALIAFLLENNRADLVDQINNTTMESKTTFHPRHTTTFWN